VKPLDTRMACGQPERRHTIILVLRAAGVIAVMFGILVLFLRMLNV